MSHQQSGYSSTDSRSNWKLERWLFVEGENRRSGRKTLKARKRTNNKLNPHMTLGPGPLVNVPDDNGPGESVE